MDAMFFIFVAVGAFFIYLSILLFRQNVSKIWPVAALVAGLLFILYPIVKDSVSSIFLSSEQPVSQSNTQAQVNSSVPPDGVKPLRFFEGDPAFAQQRAMELYAMTVALWNTTHGGYDEPEKAMLYIDSAIYYYPLAEAYNVRGQVNVQMGKIKEGLSDYNEAILLDSTQAEPHFNKGTAHYILNDLGNACKSWKKADHLGLQNAKTAIESYCN